MYGVDVFMRYLYAFVWIPNYYVMVRCNDIHLAKAFQYAALSLVGPLSSSWIGSHIGRDNYPHSNRHPHGIPPAAADGAQRRRSSGGGRPPRSIAGEVEACRGPGAGAEAGTVLLQRRRETAKDPASRRWRRSRACRGRRRRRCWGLGRRRRFLDLHAGGSVEVGDGGAGFVGLRR